MIVSILVEIFVLLTYSAKVHFCAKIPFLQTSVHGHGQDRYCIKGFAASNFDFL